MSLREFAHILVMGLFHRLELLVGNVLVNIKNKGIVDTFDPNKANMPIIKIMLKPISQLENITLTLLIIFPQLDTCCLVVVNQVLEIRKLLVRIIAIVTAAMSIFRLTLQVMENVTHTLLKKHLDMLDIKGVGVFGLVFHNVPPMVKERVCFYTHSRTDLNASSWHLKLCGRRRLSVYYYNDYIV